MGRQEGSKPRHMEGNKGLRKPGETSQPLRAPTPNQRRSWVAWSQPDGSAHFPERETEDSPRDTDTQLRQRSLRPHGVSGLPGPVGLARPTWAPRRVASTPAGLHLDLPGFHRTLSSPPLLGRPLHAHQAQPALPPPHPTSLNWKPSTASPSVLHCVNENTEGVTCHSESLPVPAEMPVPPQHFQSCFVPGSGAHLPQGTLCFRIFTLLASGQLAVPWVAVSR